MKIPLFLRIAPLLLKISINDLVWAFTDEESLGKPGGLFPALDLAGS
jgi:hypothetical protein